MSGALERKVERLDTLLQEERKIRTDIQSQLRSQQVDREKLQAQMGGLGARADSLDQEVREQQEAMDALMDMLEKTITAEDTHDLLEQLEQRVGEKLQENSASLRELAEDLHGAHEKLESSAELIVTRVDEARKDLDQEAARLEMQIREVQDKMDSALMANIYNHASHF